MPMSPHEAATMLGVPHGADAEAVEAAIARLRTDYDLQITRAVTPEIATYWRNRLARLDEAREVIRQAADARARAAEAAESSEDEEPTPTDVTGAPHPADAYTRWQEGQQLADLPETLRADDRPGLPWESATGSALERAMATVRFVLFDPRRAFDEMRRTGGIGPPLLFSLFVGLPAATVAGYVYFLLQVVMQPQEHTVTLAEAALAGAFFMPLYVAIMYPVSLFVNAGLQHLSLLVLEKSPQPFEATFRTAAYAVGAASVLQFIPIIGLLLSGAAQIAINVIGLSRTHEIPLGRAALVYFLPIVTCCACFFLIVTAGTWIGSTLGK